MAIFNRCECSAFNSQRSKICKRCGKKLGKNYYIQYAYDGKRKTERVGDSIGYAREALAKRQTDIREGKFFGKVKTIHWKDFFDTHYIKHCEANLARIEKMRYETARGFKVFQKDMNKISRVDIETYRQYLDDGSRSKSTINRYMQVVRFAFNYAESLELIDRNPVRNLKMHKEEPKERRILDYVEEAKLIEACKESSNPLLYYFVMIALYTGMRSSELINLKWSNVNSDIGSFMLYKTKNNEIREIPIMNELKPVVEDLRRVTGNYEYLFTYLETGRKAIIFRNAFQQAVKKAGIARVVIHELRHTYITRLAASGASIPEIQQISGHKTAKMVQRYTHVGLRESRRTVDRLSQFIGALNEK